MSLNKAIWATRIATMITAIMLMTLSAGNSQAMVSSSNDKPIVGAGAHFAWILFADMKKELEDIAGKSLQLFGEGSLLGVGCNAGIKTALKNTAEKETFGFTCCPLSNKELSKKKLLIHPIAKEPILIVVHENNPLNNVSSKDLRAILSGNIMNWKEVGGPDKPIIVVSRLHCAKRPGHWRKILPNKSDFRQDRLNVSSAAEMVEHINSLEYAIGHVGSAWKFKSTDKIKFLRVDNIEATAINLKNESYPYFRQLSAVTAQHPSKTLLKMLKHAQTSKTLYKIAKKYNLLPLHPQK